MTRSHFSRLTCTRHTDIQRGSTGQALQAQDESNGVKELRSLAELGITAIDYVNGRYEYDSDLRLSGVAFGQISYASAETVTLQAQQEGVKYSPVGAGIKIDTTDGPPVIVITQVKSEAAVFAGLSLTTQGETIGTDGALLLLYEDGVPYAYNPASATDAITLTLTQAQLIGNDTWHGKTGSAAGPQIAGLGNASHLTDLNLQPDGGISFKLEKNYNGDAGFDYTVAAPDATTSTANLTLHFNSNAVKAAAVCGHYTRARGPICNLKRATANDFSCGTVA